MWFRYIERNRPLVEIGNFQGIEKIVVDDYATYSGKTLELYFKQKLQESFEFRAIGSWWESKSNLNEIDIVAVYLDNKRALVVEVKRQKKDFKPQAFEEKVNILRSKAMYKFDIEMACWDMDEM